MLDGLRLPGFEGRTALVTGAGRGIGLRIAEALAAQGANVVGLDLATDAWSLPPEHSVALPCDVTDEDAVDAAFATAEERFGTVTILVNNAGILQATALEEMSLEDWRRTMDVNLTAAFLTCRRALPGMRREGYGRILCIGSSAGKSGGNHHLGAYAASKAGIMALAKSIAIDHAHEGITANALAPTLIETPMIADMQELAARIPVRRLGQPDDVAYATLMLTSSLAGYITGEVTDVNGGWLID